MKKRKRGNEVSFAEGAVTLLIAISLAFSGTGYANPSGGVIVHGDIQFAQNGSTLQVIQGTSHGIIDWTSFSIAAGETTQFIQPGPSSVTLNRVTGGATSIINGSLLANGRVFLLNSAGVVVGQGGIVDTAGFTASTLDLSNEDFLRGGDLNFRGNSSAGIVNLGRIHAVDGDVFLIAASVVNEGSISAPQGTVGLAGGNDVLIAESGSERVFVRGSGSADGGVVNRGVVQANVAELKAHGGNIYGMAVRNEGRVAATSVSREGGQIFLRAGGGGGGGVRTTGTLTAKREQNGGDIVVDSGAAGETEVSGTVEAAGTSGEGGTILVLGNRINILEASLVIADGDNGGGRILLGGGRRGLNPDFTNAESVRIGNNVSLQASARENGNGGEIITFATGELSFAGKAIARGGSDSGDGGFVEVSGQESIRIGSLSRQIDVGAASGLGGTLLVDPTDILIFDGTAGEVSTINSNMIADQDIVDFLSGDPGDPQSNGANLSIATSAGQGFGDITFQGDVDISWSSNSVFSVEADRDIVVASGAIVAAEGGGSIDFTAERAIEVGGLLSSETGKLKLEATALDLLSGGAIGNGLTAGNIELRTDSIELAGTVQSAGTLTIAPITSNRAINLGQGSPTTGLQLSSFELFQLQDGFTSVVFGDEVNGNGVIRIGTATFSDPTTFATPIGGTETIPGGEIYLEGDLTGTGNASFFFSGSGPNFEGVPSTTYLNGTISTQGQEVRISDDVVLSGDTWINTTAGSQPGGADVVIEGTVRGETEARAFTVDAGSNGQIFFWDSVGLDPDFTLIGDIDWSAGRLNLDSGVYSAGGIDITTSEYFILGDQGVINSTNHLTIKANQGASPVSGDFSGILSSGQMISTSGEIILEGRAGDSLGPSAPNIGVWLQNGSDLMASEGIRIVGAAPNGTDYGVQLDASISSLNGIVKVETLGGDVQINETVSGDGLELFGAPLGNTNFEINGVVPLFDLSADGGGGVNTLDFSGYKGDWLEIGAEQLTNIDSLYGRADLFPTFRGSGSEPGRFNIDRSSGFLYEDDTRGRIDVTDFSEVIGGSFDDLFTIDLGTSNVFDGSLDGDRGNDTFTFLSGSADSIFESDFSDGSVDLIDFSLVAAALDVNLESGEAVFGTESTTFSGIERIIGSTGYTNRIEGTDASDNILITGNGRGEIQSNWNDFDPGSDFGDFTGTETTFFSENEEGFELEGPPDMRTVVFENFALVSGGRGEDSFEVNLPSAEDFEGQLLGGDDEDTFFVMPGGSIAIIDGEGGGDTLDFSSFSDPVFVELQNSSATQVGSFSSIESVVGGSNVDTLTGTPQSDQFLVTEENGGFLNSGSFRDFEILNGIGGGDFFIFQNQANVLRFDGGSEMDTFTLDDRNLTDGQSYSISGNTVSQDSTYEFSNIESLELLLGSGNDNVLAGSNGMIQFVDGGGGFDTVDFGSTPVVGGNPFLFGSSQLSSSNVEEFIFVRDESNNPDNINNDGGGNPNPQGDGTVSDRFSGSGLTDAAANAFSAFAANALITGQAVVVQIDGTRFKLQAPASLDGFFTEPPQSIIGQLRKNLEVDAWAELANAIDFSDSMVLLRTDGPFAISLNGLPPQDILAVLEGNLLADPARELVAALEMTLVIPVTSIDGAVSILAIPVPIDQAMLALLESNLNEGAFNELTEALDQ